jgi:muramidase (phage lysozyme)
MKRGLLVPLVSLFLSSSTMLPKVDEVEVGSYSPLYKPLFSVVTLDSLRKNPRVKAFLDTIAYAEGTFNEEGYRTLYSYVLCDNFDDHPRQVICSRSKGQVLCSSAAGRYQILQKTWDRVAPPLKLKSFSPLNQDRVAIELLADADALTDVTAGRIDDAIIKSNKVWASLPGSCYGQRTIDLSELRRIFWQQVKLHMNRKGSYHA